MRETTGIVSATLALLLGAAALGAPHDDFHHLGEINKASLVMLTEEGIVPRKLASKIARGIDDVIAEQSKPGSRRSSIVRPGRHL